MCQIVFTTHSQLKVQVQPKCQHFKLKYGISKKKEIIQILYAHWIFLFIGVQKYILREILYRFS